MTIKTPVRIVGEGPNWALEDADGKMFATVSDYHKGELTQEAINRCFPPRLKPSEGVIIRRTMTV